MLRLINTVSRT